MIKNRIYLIGMMGSGKTTIAQRLAVKLHRDWVDTDALIQSSENNTITNIFEQKGENYFRLLEKETLQHLNGNNLIVACGGGLPCYYGNIDFMKTTGCVVYLHSDSHTLYQRLREDSSRPKLEKIGPNDRENVISSLLNERKQHYFQSDIVIDVNRPISLILRDLECITIAF